jgi:hypothetical protein
LIEVRDTVGADCRTIYPCPPWVIDDPAAEPHLAPFVTRSSDPITLQRVEKSRSRVRVEADSRELPWFGAP